MKIIVDGNKTRAVRFTVTKDFGFSTPPKQMFPGMFEKVTYNKDKTNGIIEHLYIKYVIYKDPVTIVFWSDNTKTVAKCTSADTYNKEAGLALCIMKKLCGTEKMMNLFDAWCPKENEVDLSSVRKSLKTKELKERNTFDKIYDKYADYPF